MRILKSFTLKWWETGLFKLSLLSLGLLLGSTWPDLFSPWRPALCVAFVLSTVYVSWVWWKQ